MGYKFISPKKWRYMGSHGVILLALAGPRVRCCLPQPTCGLCRLDRHMCLRWNEGSMSSSTSHRDLLLWLFEKIFWERCFRWAVNISSDWLRLRFPLFVSLLFFLHLLLLLACIAIVALNCKLRFAGALSLLNYVGLGGCSCHRPFAKKRLFHVSKSGFHDHPLFVAQLVILKLDCEVLAR